MPLVHLQAKTDDDMMDGEEAGKARAVLAAERKQQHEEVQKRLQKENAMCAAVGIESGRSPIPEHTEASLRRCVTEPPTATWTHIVPYHTHAWHAQLTLA